MEKKIATDTPLYRHDAAYAREHGPDVKFCVSVFRQSQEWRWKTGRILAWIP